MPSYDILSNKVRPHTWSFKKKNPPKALALTTRSSMWYFEEVEPVSPITTIPSYYIPWHMHNFEELNFENFEHGYSLDHEEVHYLVGTFFEGMRF